MAVITEEEKLKNAQNTGFGIKTKNPLAGKDNLSLSYGGEQKNFLDGSNSTMPTKQTSPQKYLPEIDVIAGNNPAAGQLGIVRKPVQASESNGIAALKVEKEPTQIASTPQIAQVATETAKQNATVQALAADPNAAIGARQKTTGAVQDPSSPQNTAPVAAENVAVNTPSETNVGARPQAVNGVKAGDNTYNTYAHNLSEQSVNLLKKPAGSFAAEDGTLVSEGANAVGAGIVSRGLANRAKSFADMANAKDAAEVAAQNANVGADASRVLNDSRIADTKLGARRADSEIAARNIETNQKRQLADLQNKYLDPKTDEATRASIAAQLAALNGKESKDKYMPLMSKDELGNPIYLGAFDTNSLAQPGIPSSVQQTKISSAGKMTPQQEALAAIATGGITKEEANKRLIAAGQQPV